MKNISLRTLRSMCLDGIIFFIPVAVGLFFLPKVLSILAPFLAGLFLYFTADPLNKFLQKNRLPSSLSAFLSLGIISAAVFFALRYTGEKILGELVTFTQNPPEIYYSAVNTATEKISVLLNKIRFNDISFSKSFTPDLSTLISGWLTKLISYVSEFVINFVKAVPSFLLSSFAAVFTAFFLLKDEEKFSALSFKFFGSKVCDGFVRFKNTFLKTATSYLKAQLLIIGIVFVILLTGFMVLKVRYAFVLSVITSVVDAVPILGTGTVLMPMSVFFFLSGNTPLGWGIVILYGITLLARQLCEPKILGKTFGIHPLIALFSIFAGMKLFGIVGLVLGPFFAIFIKILIFPQ